MFIWKLITWLADMEWYSHRIWWDCVHWRLNLAFYASLLPSGAILAAGPHLLINQIAAAIVFVICLVAGWVWDSSATNGNP